MLKLFHSFVALSFFSLSASALKWKTHDISSLLVEEANGTSYQDVNGKTMPLETIIKNGGANSVRIRLWVGPADGNYNLEYALKLAARVKAAGLGIHLNLHYSDTWADPGKQGKPAAWSSLSTTALVEQVKSYTKSVLDAFAAHSMDVQLISLGNEIRAGLLWPNGKWDQFPTMAKLLHAGVAGVKASKISSKPKIMLHLDRGYDWSTQEWFYDNLIAANFDLSSIDVQGVSCYPFWDKTNSTLANFKTNMYNMAAKYKKAIVCTETDWPTKCTKASDNIPPSLTEAFPFSAAGQKAWMKALAAIVKGIPGGLGKGVMYWEPAWVNNPSLGSACESSVLFSATSSGGKTVAKALSYVSPLPP
ncbi:arabinogalactan endo-1-4-beta-galactosidase protein [Venturia nashicola]|uniref:Arabinogalactan endo-beta-1,4-galactanase n=1 Tax=Venturia nashicola TaxID=86259 RepID=A0A4Z1PIB0_9PEZI|nr:arabinogalactan endo-1-4-beta-galactosidase protein [Venturia nashicola]